MLDAVHQMQRVGIDWPELDIINKSLRVKPVNESAPSWEEEAYRYAEDVAAQLPDMADEPDSAMYAFLHAADHPEVVGPWLAEYFQPHKELWIRWLLQQMNSDRYDTDEIYEAVHMLGRMQLGWSELDVIKRSMESDSRA